MTPSTTPTRRPGRLLPIFKRSWQRILPTGPLERFTLFVGVALVVALGTFAGLARPPLSHLGILALVLLGCALLSTLIGQLAYRLRWLRRSPRILWTLLAGYAVVGLLIFLGVLSAALLMFIDAGDVRLVAAMLLFGLGIAVSLGYLLATEMSREANRLVAVADLVAQGQFDVQVEPRGRDEMAALASAFNEMAESLAIAAQKQRELENTRLDLVAWAGHDLRTPLASVRAVVEALADGLVTDPQTVDRYLQTAKRDLRVVGLLIDDLSLLAQFDAGGLQLERHTESLNPLLSELAESFTPRAQQKGVLVLSDTDDGWEPLSFDRLQMRRALGNLLDNAVRHSSTGGMVSVGSRQCDGETRIQIWNDGPPIDPADLPHVFDRFYRSDRSRSRTTGGAGLGLAITKAIVEAHGGTVAVESEAAHGTSFTVSLPNGQDGGSQPS